MRHIVIGFAAALALGAAGCAEVEKVVDDVTASTSSASTAEEFVPAAASSNMFEIESSRLALNRSQSPDVRQFANKMIADHQQAGQQMKTTAAAAGITAPAERLQPRHQEMLDELRGMRGAEFDSRYIEMQRLAHKDAISLFDSYAEDGDRPALKSFARSTLPTLQQHHEHVEMLENNRR